MDGAKRKSGDGTITSFFGAPISKRNKAGGAAAAGDADDAAADGAPRTAVPAGAAEAAGGVGGCAGGAGGAAAAAEGSAPPPPPSNLTADEQRRLALNRSLALARRAHADALAVAAAAAAEGRAVPLRELITDATWRDALAAELARPSFAQLEKFLHAEWAAKAQVFPERGALFRALNSCPLPAVRLVILGQDPFHDDGQATGLSFSVPRGAKVPSSLQNIFKELGADVALPKPGHGDLARWAAQGVLLLNAVLSVRAHAPASHAKRGWEGFTDGVVGALLAQRRRAAAEAAKEGRPPPPPLVFLLWGKAAQEKGRSVLRAGGATSAASSSALFHVLEAPHPSGLSAHRGFFGCRHFSAANALLTAAGAEPIDWRLD